jgi:hypothetical protein
MKETTENEFLEFEIERLNSLLFSGMFDRNDLLFQIPNRANETGQKRKK